MNRISAEELYKSALELAEPSDSQRIIDVFCGIGTITLLMAQKSPGAVGIEISGQAVSDARENARINNIWAEFFRGDAKTLLPRFTKGKHNKPVTVVLDPPRAGLDPELIKTLLSDRPERIVYVSCSPQTLARDLKALSSDYDIRETVPVDMFPMTGHVESVTLITLK